MTSIIINYSFYIKLNVSKMIYSLVYHRRCIIFIIFIVIDLKLKNILIEA